MFYDLWEWVSDMRIEISVFTGLFVFIFTALFYTYEFEEQELICRTKGYETVDKIDGEYVCIYPMWNGEERG